MKTNIYIPENELQEFLEYDYDPDWWQLFKDTASGIVVAVQESSDGGWDWTSYKADGHADDGGQYDEMCPIEELLEDISDTYCVRGLGKKDFRPFEPETEEKVD